MPNLDTLMLIVSWILYPVRDLTEGLCYVSFGLFCIVEKRIEIVNIGDDVNDYDV